MMRRESERYALAVLLLVYAAASLVHFVHNAEFLGDYPNLPKTWTPAHVYLAWIGMTLIGVAGWVVYSRGFVVTGLVTCCSRWRGDSASMS